MKRILNTAVAMLSATTVLLATSDRIDFIASDGSLTSYLSAKLNKITFDKPGTNGLFSTLDVVNKSGLTYELSMNQYTSMRVVPADGQTPYEVEVVPDEHTQITLLNCYNNYDIDGNASIDPNQPEGWRGATTEDTPNYIYSSDPGYESTIKVIGKYTGTIYTADDGFIWISENDDNEWWCDAYAFWMPNEPIQIKSESTELKTYVGQKFVGTYKGYEVKNGVNRMVKGTEPTATLELKDNGAYTFQTTDSYSYDLVNLYTYDTDNNSFAYVYTEKEDWDYNTYYGIDGRFYNNDLMFINVRNITTGRGEDVNVYVVSSRDIDYVCACGDSYGSYYLVEVKYADNDDVVYYLCSSYGTIREQVNVQFTSGKSIGEASEAIVNDGTKALYKYSYDGTNAPSITAAGNEQGTYYADNSALYLDGFGAGTIDDVEGTYTAAGTIITLTTASATRFFVIDTDKNTYTEVTADTWDGADSYTLTGAVGAGESGTASSAATVTINMNKGVLGQDIEGTAAVLINLEGRPNAVQDHNSYIYSKKLGLLIISNILVGNGSGRTKRMNLILHVASDMSSMYFDDSQADRIYGMSSKGYIYTGEQNTLQGVFPEVEYASAYTAALTGSYMGTAFTSTTTLTLGKDASGADKEGYATIKAYFMGDIISDCVPYTTVGNTLTLQNVTVGDGSYGTKKVDLVFKHQSDGTLVSEGEYYGSNMTFAMATVNFGSVPFSPVTTEE